MRIHKTINNQYYNYINIDFGIIVNDIKSRTEQIKIAKSLCDTNGVFMVVINSSNQLEYLSRGYFNTPDDIYHGPNVITINEFTQGLTEPELQAIRYHEEGHIYYQHHLRSRNAHNRLLNELEADSYASRYAGAWNLVSAMKKNARNSVRMFGKINKLLLGRTIPDSDLDRLQAKLLNNPDIQKRFAILNS